MIGQRLSLDPSNLDNLHRLPPGTVVVDEDGAPGWVLDISQFYVSAGYRTCLLTTDGQRLSWAEMSMEPRILRVAYVPEGERVHNV